MRWRLRKVAEGRVIDESRYVPGDHNDPPRFWAEHLDGVKWHEAPRPPSRHVCWPQTRGASSHRLIARCACGATQLDSDGFWFNINERRGR